MEAQKFRCLPKVTKHSSLGGLALLAYCLSGDVTRPLRLLDWKECIVNVVLQGHECCQNSWDGLVRMDTGAMRAD